MNKGAVIIPARYRSSRFPGKPLALINGKPMIQHVYEACARAVLKSAVYVATDDERIRRAVLDIGGQVIMTSERCLTGTDRLAEANRVLDLDFLVNVQGDEPMVSPNDIRRVFDLMKDDCSSVVNCFCDISEQEKANPFVPKVVVSKSQRLLFMSRGGVPFDKTLVSHARYKQVCIYGFSREHLKLFSSQTEKSSNELIEDIEILRFLENDISVKMLKVNGGSSAVDTPEDLQYVSRLMS